MNDWVGSWVVPLSLWVAFFLWLFALVLFPVLGLCLLLGVAVPGVVLGASGLIATIVFVWFAWSFRGLGPQG